MAKKRKRKRRPKYEYLVLALLAALVAGAAIGVIRRDPGPAAPSTDVSQLPDLPTTPQPTTAQARTPTKAVRKVDVVARPDEHPLAEVAVILAPAGGLKEPLPEFEDHALRTYSNGGLDSPFRQSVLAAVKTLEGLGPLLQTRRLAAPAQTDPRRFVKELLEPLLKQQQADQDRLEAVLADLQAHQDRAPEPKRWRANHDFVLSRVLAHLAILHELNFQLRALRSRTSKGEAVPPGGWDFLAAAVLTQGEESEALASLRNKVLDRLANENKGTPWQAIAEQEKTLPLGVRVKPAKP